MEELMPHLNGTATEPLPPSRVASLLDVPENPGAGADGAVGRPSVTAFTRADLKEDERGQFGEVEILVDLIDYYGAENNWFVDVGCHDGVLFSNSRAFRERGWNVVGIDRSEEQAEKARALDPQMHCVVQGEVTRDGPYTLDWLIEGVTGPADEGGVPTDFDILSIDIDGMDYHIWESLSKYKPRIVCIEINDFGSSFWEGEYVPEYGKPLEQIKANTGDVHDKRTTALSMSLLAKRLGYTPIALTRTNAIYVRNDVVASRPIKLNLGNQGTYLRGFIGVDHITGDAVYPLTKYAGGSVSEIYASHVLEHFSHRHTMDVLREWSRVLEPDGKIRIAVPDWDKITDPKVVPDFAQRTMYLFGGHVDKHDRHGALFTAQSLTAQMRHVGFEFVQPWESEIIDCASLPVSLNLGGIKRGFKKKDNPVVIAVVSQPRIIFADASNALHRSMRLVANKAVFRGNGKEPLLDDIIYCGGAYWEKALTAGIKSAINHGADLIVFTDYDTTNAPEDVQKLIDMMQEDTSISAVFAVQASRHHDAALVQMEYVKYEGDQTPVTLGHFGLTVIRAEVFRDLPHPWLWSMPHPVTGEWDTPGHCDADITFWRILHENGHKVVQANHVQAGHLVLCNKWMTENGVAYQPIEHYRAFGRPKEAVFNAEAMYKSRSATIARRKAEADHAQGLKPEEVEPNG